MKWPCNKKAVFFDSEFDIEGEEVFAVDRDEEGDTCISYYDKLGANQECFLLTTIEKHNDYVNRYRRKLYLEKCANANANKPTDTKVEFPKDENINDIYK